MLLVLDNFEHVLGAAQVVTNVLSTCPRLKILVTSRAPLQLGSEHRYTVPPLPIPVPADAADIGMLAGVPSVALFSLRARAVESGW
jgi:predicted ATPase